MENKASAKDFFLHLGVMASLYAVAISFLNLLFKIINNTYTPVDYNIYVWGASSQISLPVATLIIVFPIFVLLSWLLEKSYAADPGKKQIAVRRWLIYITLFVAGVILVSDLVMVLYKFLDGQDLTAAFALKALAVFLTAGCVFGFYLQDIRERLSSKSRKVWATLSALAVLVAIILGFAVIGSPRDQRLLRYDGQKANDLQNIQWQIVSYWQRKSSLPNAIDELGDPLSGYVLPVDPQSGAQYEYKKIGSLTFELCAEFNLESSAGSKTGYSSSPYMEPIGKGMDLWNHPVGKQCFERTIDPELYPTTPQKR